MFSGMTELDKPQMNGLPLRRAWFSPGCRAACVRKSIRPLVLISPTYISLQINDTAEKGKSIGDKVKVSLLPAHRAQGWDGGQRGSGEPRRREDETKQVCSFVFHVEWFHSQMSVNNHRIGTRWRNWIRVCVGLYECVVYVEGTSRCNCSTLTYPVLIVSLSFFLACNTST